MQNIQTRKHEKFDAAAILDATHADVLVRSTNGQEWRLIERMEKSAAVKAADAVYDTLTLTSRGSDFSVHIRYYTPEA